MGQANDGTCSGTATTATWASALAYCNGLSLAGKTWHLPSVNELKSIVDETKLNPSDDITYFSTTVANFYWSSSTYVGFAANAWFVDFNVGGVNCGGFGKTSSYYVRCVSGP